MNNSLQVFNNGQFSVEQAVPPEQHRFKHRRTRYLHRPAWFVRQELFSASSKTQLGKIAFKAVVSPIILSLRCIADELEHTRIRHDYEDNALYLMDWIEKLDSVTRKAHEIIDGYIAPLGYHAVDSDELETPYTL